jgi:hypothetical protein
MRGRRPQAGQSPARFVDGIQTRCRLPGGNRPSSEPRKEVIQPQVPLRLPCYDFAPVADLTVVGCLLLRGQRTGFG